MIEIIFGFIAGIFTGMGMGGGTILILLLSIFMNFNQHLAQATNLVFFIPTSISSIVMNIKQKNIDFKLARSISIFGVIGAIIGANISKNINSILLRKVFAIFILVIAIYEIYRLYKENKSKIKNK